MIMCIQKLIKFCPFILKIWIKNQILESIKGRNSVANLQKTTTTIYNTSIDLVNGDVYTEFGLILSIFLKTLSKNQIVTSIKGRKPIANLLNNDLYHQRRSCQ